MWWRVLSCFALVAAGGLSAAAAAAAGHSTIVRLSGRDALASYTFEYARPDGEDESTAPVLSLDSALRDVAGLQLLSSSGSSWHIKPQPSTHRYFRATLQTETRSFSVEWTRDNDGGGGGGGAEVISVDVPADSQGFVYWPDTAGTAGKTGKGRSEAPGVFVAYGQGGRWKWRRTAEGRIAGGRMREGDGGGDGDEVVDQWAFRAMREEIERERAQAESERGEVAQKQRDEELEAIRKSLLEDVEAALDNAREQNVVVQQNSVAALKKHDEDFLASLKKIDEVFYEAVEKMKSQQPWTVTTIVRILNNMMLLTRVPSIVVAAFGW